MNTCVLCLRRLNAFACTIRSRSRWNGVRGGESSSATALRAGYERVASGPSQRSSCADMRSWKSMSTLTAMRGIVPRGEAESVRDGRLGGRHARDRHPVRRAAHVVEARHVEEGDRLGIAAVLAADAQLEVRLGLASRPRSEPHQPPDARLVDGLERAAVDDLRLDVAVQEAALHVVAREPQGSLRQVV